MSRRRFVWISVFVAAAIAVAFWQTHSGQPSVARVLIVLRGDWTIESGLTETERDEQRQRIRAAQDALISDMAPYEFSVGHRFTTTPQLDAFVGDQAREVLEAHPLVEEVNDSLVAEPS